MRDLKLVLLMFFLAVLQSVVLSRVTVFGVSADLPIAMAALLAFLKGPREGFWFGALAGLLSDALSPAVFTVVVSASMTCFLLGLLKERFFSEEEPVMFVFVFAGTFFTYLATSWLLSGILGRPLSGVWQVIFLVSAINVLFTPYLKALLNKAESEENGRRLKI
jgi:rod shape-determining protein MreD